MKNTPALLTRGGAALVLGVSLAIAGCASTPRTSALLGEAQAAYERAQADATVTANAATELQRARQLLDTAQSALQSREEPEVVDHYAYLARQQVQLAEQRAVVKAAEQRIAASEGERTRIQLSAREREVEAARQQATVAQARAQGAQQVAQQARDRAAQLEADLAELEAQRTERGLVVTLGNDVLFDTGRSELKAGANRALDQLAKLMQEHPERSVLIEGFTDSVGAEDYNMDLSRRRADAVRSALLSRGVAADRVAAVGYGEQYAIASNADAGGRQLNRRVEVVISDEAGRIASR